MTDDHTECVAPSDALIERIIRETTGLPEGAQPVKHGIVWQGVSYTLAALQPGDVIREGVEVVDARDFVDKARAWDQLEPTHNRAARQASAAMRERCIDAAPIFEGPLRTDAWANGYATAVTQYCAAIGALEDET